MNFNEWLNLKEDSAIVPVFTDRMEESPGPHTVDQFLTLIKREFMMIKRQFTKDYIKKYSWHTARPYFFNDLIHITDLELARIISYTHMAKEQKYLDIVIEAFEEAAKYIKDRITRISAERHQSHWQIYPQDDAHLDDLIKGVAAILKEIEEFYTELKNPRVGEVFKRAASY